MLPIATADVETDPFGDHETEFPQPFCSAFHDGARTSVFWGPDCMDKLAERISSFKGYVYFHNGGKFDVRYLLRLFYKYHPFDSKPLIINGRLAQVRFGQAEIRDSFLILPVPLSAYEKDKIEYWKFTVKNREKFKEEICRYLRGDVSYLREAIIKFFDRFGFSLTLSNRGFAELKKFGYEPVRASEHYDSTFRQFYYGGRVECFQKGIIKRPRLEYLDINSAYPFAMLSEHWFGLEYICWPVLPKDEKTLQKSFIEADVWTCGAVPIRDEKTDEISFPTGNYRVRCTGWEILAGLQTNTLKIINVVAVYIPTECTDFSKFVNHFYHEKLEAEKRSDKAGRLFAKLMLNASYGRFALDPRKFRDYKFATAHRDDCANLEAGWSLEKEWEEEGISLWSKPAAYKSGFFNVATAASITGFVRAYLWRAAHAVRNPLYCDTDSLVCESRNDLSVSSELGSWKLEAIGTEMAIAGKKLYAFKCDTEDVKNLSCWNEDGKGPFIYKTASKGVKLTPKKIFDVAMGKKVSWKSEAPRYSFKRADGYTKREIKLT